MWFKTSLNHIKRLRLINSIFGISDAFLVAVRDVAEARGISTVAENAGLGRESLYKALKTSAKPRFDTVRRLLAALGVKLDVVPPHTHA